MKKEPFLLLEAKLSDTQPSRALTDFQRKLNVPAVQLTNSGEGYRIIKNDGQNTEFINRLYSDSLKKNTMIKKIP